MAGSISRTIAAVPDSETVEAALPNLLDTFYARIRADAVLGPIFNGAVSDWPEHLARIEEFWSSVMLGSGRYKGNPVARHMRHTVHMTPEHFERWLAIWRETTDELLAPPIAQAMQDKARRIAESLRLAIEFASAAQRSQADPGGPGSNR